MTVKEFSVAVHRRSANPRFFDAKLSPTAPAAADQCRTTPDRIRR